MKPAIAILCSEYLINNKKFDPVFDLITGIFTQLGEGLTCFEVKVQKEQREEKQSPS